MKKLTNTSKIVVWDAPNSPGEPVCITGDSDEGLSLNVYEDNDGNVMGVTVHEKEMGDMLTAAGLIPAEVALEYAN